MKPWTVTVSEEIVTEYVVLAYDRETAIQEVHAGNVESAAVIDTTITELHSCMPQEAKGG